MNGYYDSFGFYYGYALNGGTKGVKGVTMAILFPALAIATALFFGLFRLREWSQTRLVGTNSTQALMTQLDEYKR
jgi:hypothetical protein